MMTTNAKAAKDTQGTSSARSGRSAVRAPHELRGK